MLGSAALPQGRAWADVSPSLPANVPEAGHLIDGLVPDATAGQTVLPEGFAGLQLDVSINGYRLMLISGFNKKPDGTLTSARSELEEIGIKVPGKGSATEQILLSSIPTLTYSYDEPHQAIDLRLDDAQRKPKIMPIFPEERLPAAVSDYGALLNYSAFTAASGSIYGQSSFNGAGANIEARVFSKFGVFQQTATVSTPDFGSAVATRLDTSYTYSNQNRAETYRAGDFVTGSLNWTRSIRMGGVQVQRNFNLRPDLITTPLAALRGSAAVPSTLDLYVNGQQSFSQDIQPGPFEITRLPIMTGTNDAKLVLTDTSGNQLTYQTPLYSGVQLLAPGIFYYDVDLGTARRSYGLESFGYDNELMAMASARYGLRKGITLEGHVEVKPDLVDVGLGGVLLANKFGTFNLAGAASYYKGDVGYFGYGAWDLRLGPATLHASTARTFGNFTDLAAATAVTPSAGVGVAARAPGFSSAMPKAIDQASLNYGFTDYNALISGTLAHVQPQVGNEQLLAELTASKTFKNGMSVFANAYYDFANQNNYGAGVGLTMTFGPKHDINVSSTASDTNGRFVAQASAAKGIGSGIGSYGWSVTDQLDNSNNIGGSVSYRTQVATVTGSAQEANGSFSGRAQADGSVVATKGGVFASNPIPDAFAVVNVGVPDIDVSYENGYVGKTNKNGKLLIPELHSYYPGKISIDPTQLPLNSNVSEVTRKIVPREMSGVTVDFGVTKDTSDAIVILQDKTGKVLIPGTPVTLDGHSEPFIMGYDGQVFITDLAPTNSLVASVNGVDCKAKFNYTPDPTKQVVVGPLTCE